MRLRTRREPDAVVGAVGDRDALCLEDRDFDLAFDAWHNQAPPSPEEWQLDGPAWRTKRKARRVRAGQGEGG